MNELQCCYQHTGHHLHTAKAMQVPVFISHSPATMGPVVLSKGTDWAHQLQLCHHEGVAWWSPGRRPELHAVSTARWREAGADVGGAKGIA